MYRDLASRTDAFRRRLRLTAHLRLIAWLLWGQAPTAFPIGFGNRTAILIDWLFKWDAR
jgi:hypothetical protein